MMKIICIYTTHDSTEADLIKAQLENDEILCFLKTDNAGGVLPYLNMMSGIRILIRQEDESKARQLLT